MKIFCFTILAALFLLISKNGIQAQSNGFLPEGSVIKSLNLIDSSFYFTSQGDDLFYRKWVYPNTPKDEKVLLIIHGIGYHSYPYKKIMHYLENDNIMLYAMDLRGHGLSGKSKVVMESNDIVMTDMDNMISIIRKENPESKIYLLGTSLGGLYALGYAIHDTANRQISGLILVGAALKTRMSQMFKLKTLLYLFPAAFNRQKPIVYLDGKRLEQSSDDPGFINSRRNDSLSIHYVSVDYLSEIREMQKTCKKKSSLAQISLPVLIQHGGKDKIIDLKGSYYLEKRLVNSDPELIVYPTSKHTLFWDCDSSKVFHDLEHWIAIN